MGSYSGAVDSTPNVGAVDPKGLTENRVPSGCDSLLVHYCPSGTVCLSRNMPGYPLVGVTRKHPVPEEQNALRNLSTGFPVSPLGCLEFLILGILPLFQFLRVAKVERSTHPQDEVSHSDLHVVVEFIQ